LADIFEFEVGDVVGLLWLDACRCRGVRLNTSVKENTIKTEQFTVGVFAGIYRDLAYSKPHIILVNEITDGVARIWDSIPQSLVLNGYRFGKIPFEFNVPEKVVKKIVKSIKPDRFYRRVRKVV